MKKCVCACIAVFITAAALFAERISAPMTGTWKYHFGDDMTWRAPDIDESDWAESEDPLNVKMEGQWVWLRRTVTVPETLSGGELFVQFGQAKAAYDAYADGVYIGSFGTLPPQENVRPLLSKMVPIPSSAIHDSTVVLAYRCWCPVTSLTFEHERLGNQEFADHINYLGNLLNMRVYVILAALCLFLCMYAFSEYFSDHKNKMQLPYALSLLFISAYFYDIGAEHTLLSFSLQHALCRWCLPVSIGFILFFLKQYLGEPLKKRTVIAKFTLDGIFLLAFLILKDNTPAVELLFTVCLLPIAYVMIYSVVASVRAVMRHQEDVVPIMIGLVIAFGFGAHDVVYQAQGLSPFAWLQGISFFSLNISAFIAQSIHSARMQQRLDVLTKETAQQRDRLSNLFARAKTLAAETSSISVSLNEAVSTVAGTSDRSFDDAQGISRAIEEQNKTISTAAGSVNMLVASLRKTTDDLEQEAQSITSAAAGTAKLIEGFTSAGEGIKGAAGFAGTLAQFTSIGMTNMRELSSAMSGVQKNSHEILSVVQVLDDFAERTNLLAMNASIEAAHAGAAGKGFAVVANEIKSLASSSSAQAKKIGDLITSVESSVQSGVALCSKVSDSLVRIQQEAQTTSDQVKSASDEMLCQQQESSRITEESALISSYAETMKKSASEQYSYSEQVNSGMTALSAVSKKVDEAVKSIAEGSKTLTVQVENLRGLSEKAGSAAQQLSQMMVD